MRLLTIGGHAGSWLALCFCLKGFVIHQLNHSIIC
jgi:hypothetical protein